jgi:hypothetical protein
VKDVVATTTEHHEVAGFLAAQSLIGPVMDLKELVRVARLATIPGHPEG